MKHATIAPMRATNDQQIATMVQELQRQAASRRDYVVPARDIRAFYDTDEMVKFKIHIGDDHPPALYEPTMTAHEGMYYRLGISKPYYEKMGDQAPDLLAYNINYWLERENRNFLMRTIDGKARALLSDRFRALDNAELFFTTFQETQNVGAKIVQADLTETSFYMKVLHPEWAEKIDGFRTDVWARRTNRPNGQMYHVLEHLEEDGGMWLVPGIVVSNSDVGYRSLSADLFIFDTICFNGLTHTRTVHKVHLGKQMDVGFISQSTRDLQDAAIWGEVRDMIRGSFNRDEFLAFCRKLAEASETILEEPVAAVDLVVKNHGFTDDDKQNIINQLIFGGNTVYGLITAVTAVGRDKQNYDEGVRFERAGSDILENQRDFVRVRRTQRRVPATVG